MGIFKRSRTIEEGQALRAAAQGSAADFLAIYRAADATAPELGADLLRDALTNNDPAARVAIADRLLDDGVDPAAVRTADFTELHLILDRTTHDAALEAPLVARLLDAGADVNAVTRRGTPLETIAAKFQLSDAQLEPLYDVLLARPEIDLLQPGLDGRPVLTNLRKWAAKRAALLARAEAVLTERGIDVPPQEPTK